MVPLIAGSRKGKLVIREILYNPKYSTSSIIAWELFRNKVKGYEK